MTIVYFFFQVTHGLHVKVEKNEERNKPRNKCAHIYVWGVAQKFQALKNLIL